MAMIMAMRRRGLARGTAQDSATRRGPGAARLARAATVGTARLIRSENVVKCVGTVGTGVGTVVKYVGTVGTVNKK